MGKSFANEPAVSVMTDATDCVVVKCGASGRFFRIANAATIAAIASASLCPLAANSTMTSGFQA